MKKSILYQGNSALIHEDSAAQQHCVKVWVQGIFCLGVFLPIHCVSVALRVDYNHTYIIYIYIYIRMYGVFTLSFAGELPCFRSYTICMYVSGQPYLNLPLQKCNNAGPAAQQELRLPLQKCNNAGPAAQQELYLPLQNRNNAGPAAQQDRIGGQGLGTEARPLSSVLEKIRANKQKLAEK